MSTIPPFQNHSEEIQDIIGQVPRWITRWGLTMMLLLLLLFIFLSRFIHLPVTLEAKSFIRAQEQPFRITWMKTEPHVDYALVVRQNQWVKRNDTLLIEHNSVTQRQVYHTSSIAGRVLLMKGTEDKPVASVLVVVPSFQQYETELMIPIKGAGNVRKGQKVIIRLEEFPENEYGFLMGEIESMVPVPIDNFYRSKVKLNSGLLTNLHKPIPLLASLRGNADIIVENPSIFQKIFGHLF